MPKGFDALFSVLGADRVNGNNDETKSYFALLIASDIMPKSFDALFYVTNHTFSPSRRITNLKSLQIGEL
jgi:hypothetical protein